MTAHGRPVLLPDDPFWEACARHQNRSTTRHIGHFFLCDDCTVRLTEECFSSRPPIHHGDTFSGYCVLCGEQKLLALRQWFICPICLNVVLSYPKAVVASSAVHRFWQETIAPVFPDLLLLEQDIVQIEPFIPGRRSQRVKAQSVASLDFLVCVRRGESAIPIFHIKLKTGPGSPEDMPEFQLDVNDYNDIITVVRRTNLPSYVFHIQAVQEYTLPTWRTVARGMWWTDVFMLRSGLIAVRRRRQEDKDAAYFNASVFRPFGDFVAELSERRYELHHQRLLAEGISELPPRRS